MATILVVDDRPTDRQFLVTLLGYGGHRLMEAADGVDALAAAESQPPDLIIADVLMPTMDGFELVRRLRANPATARTPVIFYTASYLQEEARLLAESCGVTHILIKPSDPELILSIIADALDAPRPAPIPIAREAFHQQHLQLVTQKLSQKLDVVIPRLAALIELGQRLAAETEPLRLLELFCQSARHILGARYAVVDLANSGRPMHRYFLTSGLSAEEIARIGALPDGHGILERVRAADSPLRLGNLDAADIPPYRPKLRCLIGMTIRSPGQRYGWVYLADKIGVNEFSEEDEQLIATLAAQVAVAYENALRHDELQREVAERRRAEEEVRTLNAELERRVAERTAQLTAANQELEAFSYSVSHDLRAPLRGINGFSQILEEDYASQLDEEGRNHLQRIRSAAAKMDQLINDLLNLARLTRAEMQREPVNLSLTAREIAAEFQAREPERQVDFIIADTPPVEGDRRMLRIALENLLGNAWKFTGKQPQARIEFEATEEQTSRVVFSVRDNGAGFDMAFADKLFGAFQRLHSPQEFEGTGIGLATVRRVIHRHGGQVWAESAPGQGAVFYFTLALQPQTIPQRG